MIYDSNYKIVANLKAVFAVASGFAVMGLNTLPAAAASVNHSKEYSVNLQPLNGSGVTGTAQVKLEDTTLTVRFDAMGLLPNKVHDAHIHGMLSGAPANCPTMVQDTNGDGYVSVFEGAPAYGPIKVSLSAPITAPGPNPITALFAPYAGIDSNSFQSSDEHGMDHYAQSFTYNLNDNEAAAAYNGIMPLKAQEIVIHGAMAPESVDTMGGSTTKVVYDELLPVACADLSHAMGGDPIAMPSMSPNSGQMDMSDMPMMKSHSMITGQNSDQQLSMMYEMRNAFIDMLNRAGDVMARDRFLMAADSMIQKFQEALRN